MSAETTGLDETTAAWEQYLGQLEDWTTATDADPSLARPAPQPPVGEPMPERYGARAHQLLVHMQSCVQNLAEARETTGRQLSRLKGLPSASAAEAGTARYLDRSA